MQNASDNSNSDLPLTYPLWSDVIMLNTENLLIFNLENSIKCSQGKNNNKLGSFLPRSTGFLSLNDSYFTALFELLVKNLSE